MRPLSVPLTRDTAGQPVWLVSGLGGHVIPFRPLARRLAPDVRLTGLLYPVFAGEPEPPADLAALARRMRRDLPAEGPVLLAGYSLGAAVAWEIAHLLAAEGRAAGVIVIDGRPPRLARLRPAPVRLIGRFARRLRGQPVGYKDRQPMQDLPRLAAASYFAPLDAAWASWVPQPCDVPLVVIRATDPPPDGWRRVFAPDLGWSAAGEVRAVLDVAGAHRDLFQPPQDAALARALHAAVGLLGQTVADAAPSSRAVGA